MTNQTLTKSLSPRKSLRQRRKKHYRKCLGFWLRSWWKSASLAGVNDSNFHVGPSCVDGWKDLFTANSHVNATPIRGDPDPTASATSAVSVLRRADDHWSRAATQTSARPTPPD